MKNVDHCNTHTSSYNRSGRFRFPIILILIGLLFLAVNTGWIPTIYKPLFSSWPIWLIFGGLFFLIHATWFMATSLLTVGIFYIIPQIGATNPALNIPTNFTQLYWPALLIVAGAYFLFARTCKSGPKCRKHFMSDNIPTSSFNTEDGVIYIKSGFDSRKHIVMDPIFKGGTVETGFGEVIVDLRKTNLQEGKTYLKVSVSFGSANIIVPGTWNVQVRGESAFGSFVDARMSPSYDPNSNSTLIIEGKCSFGECKIRD